MLSNVDFGFTVSTCAAASDGNDVIVGEQDGILHMYPVEGDILSKEVAIETTFVPKMRLPTAFTWNQFYRTSNE